MPAGTVYAKGIQNFAASVVNGYLNFAFEVVDNYSDQTSTGDSITQYSYYFPETLISLKLALNLNAGYGELFEISCQNTELSFAQGEYYDIANGVLLDPNAVYGLVSGALSI